MRVEVVAPIRFASPEEALAWGKLFMRFAGVGRIESTHLCRRPIVFHRKRRTRMAGK